MKTAEMLGCNCLQYRTYMKEIIAVFMKADELGIKYHGGPFKFCPFCGSSFEELRKFKAGELLYFHKK